MKNASKNQMSDFKNIQGIHPLNMVILENKEKKLKNYNISRNNSFEQLFASSLRDLYNKDMSLKKNTVNIPPIPASNKPSSSTETLIKLDPDNNIKFKECLKTVLMHEGSSLVKEDGGGKESSKYGITESTAKEFGYKGNIRSLTMANAETIYRKIWDKSGAGSLPYPLSVVHFDTYVNSPAMAKKILKQSGGNVDAYLGLRLERYNRLAQLRPERFGKYLRGWTNRVNNLKVLTNVYVKEHNDYGRRIT